MNWPRGLFRAWAAVSALWLALAVSFLGAFRGENPAAPPIVVFMPGGGTLLFEPGAPAAAIEREVEDQLALAQAPTAGLSADASRAEARRLVEDALAANLEFRIEREASARAKRRGRLLG
jgi:hypothetical protein